MFPAAAGDVWGRKCSTGMFPVLDFSVGNVPFLKMHCFIKLITTNGCSLAKEWFGRLGIFEVFKECFSSECL